MCSTWRELSAVLVAAAALLLPVQHVDASSCDISDEFSQSRLGEALKDDAGNFYQVKIPEALGHDRAYVRLVGERLPGFWTLHNYGKRVDLYEEVIREAVLQPLLSDLWMRDMAGRVLQLQGSAVGAAGYVRTLFSIAAEVASVNPHVRDLTNLKYIPGGTASRDLVNSLKSHGRPVREAFGGQGRALAAFSAAVDLAEVANRVGDVALATGVLQALATDEADVRLSELEHIIGSQQSIDPAIREAMSRVRINLDAMMQETMWRDYLSALIVAIDDHWTEMSTTGVAGLIAYLPHGWAFAIEFKVIMNIYDHEELLRRACCAGELWALLRDTRQADFGCLGSVMTHLGLQFYDYQIRALSTGETKFKDFMQGILLGRRTYREWVQYYQEALDRCRSWYQPEPCQTLARAEFRDAAQASNATILFLLDVSGSMDDPAPGSSVRKIEAAKDALGTALRQLAASPGNEFGLLTFGGRCETDLMVDFTGSADAVATTMAPLQPSGSTPIELAIRRGAQILRDRPSATNLSLILISDGMETCNGDPVQAARELNLQGTGGLSQLFDKMVATAYAADQSTPIRFVVVAFDVEPDAQRQLEAIAQAGQGTFHRAENVAQLVQALTKAAMEIHYWEGEAGSVAAPPPPQTVVVVLPKKGTDPLWYVLGALWIGILVLGSVAVVVARRRQDTPATATAAAPMPTAIPEARWGRLVVMGSRGGAWNLTKPVVTVGRSPSNDIVLDDGKTSARHAQIERRAGGAKIIDLGSTNGTLVNGQQVKTASVVTGDQIKIGETTLEYRQG